MKKLFSVKHDTSTTDIVLLIIRVTVAVLMITHGWPKFNHLIAGGEIKFLPFLGMSPAFSLALAVFAEVFCSILILIGFGTRLSSIPLIITMLVAVFYVHSDDPFSKQEMGLHYLISYIILLIAGSGKYSVDYLISKKPAMAR